MGGIAGVRTNKCKVSVTVGKHKLEARARRCKLGARGGKYKLGARAGKYKLGARVEARKNKHPCFALQRPNQKRVWLRYLFELE